jgi:hypothetical protein
MSTYIECSDCDPYESLNQSELPLKKDILPQNLALTMSSGRLTDLVS